MPTLDQLMDLPGAYGAIEFSCTGELGEMRGELASRRLVREVEMQGAVDGQHA